MSEPMNDFEQRLADDLRRMTEAAPRRVDFAEEARLIAGRPKESRQRWRRIVPLAVATAALAAVATLVVLDLAPFNRPPAGIASPAARPTPGASASTSPDASASSVPAADIDLSELAWYDLTDTSFGQLTGPQPEATPLPSPYGELRVGTLDGHLAAEVHLEQVSFANGPYPAGVLAGQDNGSSFGDPACLATHWRSPQPLPDRFPCPDRGPQPGRCMDLLPQDRPDKRARRRALASANGWLAPRNGWSTPESIRRRMSLRCRLHLPGTCAGRRMGRPWQSSRATAADATRSPTAPQGARSVGWRM